MPDAAKAAASVAARMHAATMPAEVTGAYRLPEGERFAAAQRWVGYRAEVVTRSVNSERHVYTGQVIVVAELRQNGQTGGVVVIADSQYRQPTGLSLAVVDSIRGAQP